MSWFLLGLALMAGAIGQGIGDVRSRARQGVPGGWVYSDPNKRTGFGLNASPQAAQVGTIQVDTATNSATYTWVINGITLTYTADSSTSATEVGDGIVAAINAEPLVRAYVSASNNAGLVTVTALTPGVAFTMSDGDAKLTTTEASTAAASASSVAFGRAVIRTGLNTNESERLVAVPTTALFTAQVQTVSITYVSTAVVVCNVYEVRAGHRFLIGSAKMISATDRDTTIDGLVTALNAAMPANTVDFAADNATGTAIVGTAEIKGFEFDLEVFHSDVSTAPTITKTNTTGPSEATSLHRAWRGISLYSAAEEASTIGGTEGSYAANSGVNYAITGCVWVTSAQTPSSGDTVYVELAPGSTAGRFYTDASSTRVALSTRVARWERDGSVSTDSLAAIRLEA